jgi:hypothetical protein
VALAFNASAVNYSQNEAMFKAMNTARQALLRITTEIRTAQAVALMPSAVDPDSSQCTIFTSDGRNITYRFDSGNNTLYLDDNNTSTSYVMCDNVTAITFERTPVPVTPPAIPSAIRNVRISMTVSVDNLSQTLATAAVLRRNL